LIDNNGVRNPDADNLISFSLEGPAEILSVGSSNPMGTESFKQPFRKAYQGRCLVIIKAFKSEGEIKLTAISEGLETGEIVINSMPQL
jgi:beta-galactosidase